MSVFPSAPPRPVVRALLTFLLATTAMLLLYQPPAHALEKALFGDVVVEPGQSKGDVSALLGDVEIRGPVEGNVRSGFGDVRVYEPVTGGIEADFGDVYIDSRVTGDVKVGHGQVDLGPEGFVAGDLYCENCQWHELPEEQVEGQKVFGMASGGMASGFGAQDEGSRIPGFAGWLFATLVFVAVSVLAAVVAPRPLESSARKIDEYMGRSLLVGVASVPAALLLSVVLAVSIVGIPLLLLAAPIYLAFVFFGALVAAYFLGKRVLLATGRYHAGNALAAAIGAFILTAAYLVPFIGGLLLYALALLGTGAAILAIFSRRGSPAYPSYEAYVRDRRA